jgi:tetratricopeptide (TPR) repeat protein
MEPRLHKHPLILVASLFVALLSHPALARQAGATPPAPNSPAETHLGKGYDALKQDRYEEAIQEFRAALAADPSLVLRARFPLGVALFESHKSDEARQEFEQVRREVGDHPNVLYYLGRLDVDSQNYPSAIRNLSKAVLKPPFPDTAYYLGYAYFKKGDLANAAYWLREAKKATPRDARVPYQLGFVYRKQGLEDQAKKEMALSQQLRQKDNDESRIKNECAEKLEHGPSDAAHALCDQLYDPNNADRLTTLGTIYGQHGDLQAALKPLQRAAELAPQNPQMQYNLALTYFQLNRFEDARRPLEETLKRWPDIFQLNSLYAAVLIKLGHLAEAYSVLHHARELNPDSSETAAMLYATASDLGQASLRANNYSDALRYYGEAAAVRPQEAAPHRRMAEIYTLTGRTTEAQGEQEKADQLAKGPVAN